MHYQLPERAISFDGACSSGGTLQRSKVEGRRSKEKRQRPKKRQKKRRPDSGVVGEAEIRKWLAGKGLRVSASRSHRKLPEIER